MFDQSTYIHSNQFVSQNYTCHRGKKKGFNWKKIFWTSWHSTKAILYKWPLLLPCGMLSRLPSIMRKSWQPNRFSMGSLSFLIAWRLWSPTQMIYIKLSSSFSTAESYYLLSWLTCRCIVSLKQEVVTNYITVKPR